MSRTARSAREHVDELELDRAGGPAVDAVEPRDVELWKTAQLDAGMSARSAVSA